jgi:hypothetical protein
MTRLRVLVIALIVGMAPLVAAAVQADDQVLPSWNEGATKQSITEFVNRVTNEGSADFVPAGERTAPD